MEKLKIEIPVCCYKPSELPEPIQQMAGAALDAASKAYAPYSGFQVGAAVLLDNGEVITGSNQENAAYPAGICAERTALFSANHQYPETAVLMLVVAALQNDRQTGSISPCGICRQVLLETERRQQKPIRIFMCGAESVRRVDCAADLLPVGFDAGNLIQNDEE